MIVWGLPELFLMVRKKFMGKISGGRKVMVLELVIRKEEGGECDATKLNR